MIKAKLISENSLSDTIQFSDGKNPKNLFVKPLPKKLVVSDWFQKYAFSAASEYFEKMFFTEFSESSIKHVTLEEKPEKIPALKLITSLLEITGGIKLIQDFVSQGPKFDPMVFLDKLIAQETNKKENKDEIFLARLGKIKGLPNDSAKILHTVMELLIRTFNKADIINGLNDISADICLAILFKLFKDTDEDKKQKIITQSALNQDLLKYVFIDVKSEDSNYLKKFQKQSRPNSYSIKYEQFALYSKLQKNKNSLSPYTETVELFSELESGKKLLVFIKAKGGKNYLNHLLPLIINKDESFVKEILNYISDYFKFMPIKQVLQDNFFYKNKEEIKKHIVSFVKLTDKYLLDIEKPVLKKLIHKNNIKPQQLMKIVYLPNQTDLIKNYRSAIYDFFVKNPFLLYEGIKSIHTDKTTIIKALENKYESRLHSHFKSGNKVLCVNTNELLNIYFRKIIEACILFNFPSEFLEKFIPLFIDKSRFFFKDLNRPISHRRIIFESFNSIFFHCKDNNKILTNSLKILQKATSNTQLKHQQILLESQLYILQFIQDDKIVTKALDELLKKYPDCIWKVKDDQRKARNKRIPTRYHRTSFGSNYNFVLELMALLLLKNNLKLAKTFIPRIIKIAEDVIPFILKDGQREVAFLEYIKTFLDYYSDTNLSKIASNATYITFFNHLCFDNGTDNTVLSIFPNNILLTAYIDNRINAKRLYLDKKVLTSLIAIKYNLSRLFKRYFSNKPSFIFWRIQAADLIDIMDVLINASLSEKKLNALYKIFSKNIPRKLENHSYPDTQRIWQKYTILFHKIHKNLLNFNRLFNFLNKELINDYSFIEELVSFIKNNNIIIPQKILNRVKKYIKKKILTINIKSLELLFLLTKLKITDIRPQMKTLDRFAICKILFFEKKIYKNNNVSTIINILSKLELFSTKQLLRLKNPLKLISHLLQIAFNNPNDLYLYANGELFEKVVDLLAKIKDPALIVKCRPMYMKTTISFKNKAYFEMKLQPILKGTSFAPLQNEFSLTKLKGKS
ncbi:hypothetical protein ACFLZV_01055 [Candidatus Margulisiibacteriota bacterium]